MLSRVADSIYWMARYVERAENVARFVDVNLNLVIDLGPDVDHQWAPLVYTTGDHEAFHKRFGLATQDNVVQFLTFDEENANSILSCLKAARENARMVREIISSQMWEEVNKFYMMVRDAKSDRANSSHYEFFNQVKNFGALIEGVAESTMSRGEAWYFRRLGRFLERADKTSRILDVKYFLLLPSAQEVGTQFDTNQWAALLKSASALEMYRKTYGRITPLQVAEFLILNRDFPRALRFCLMRAEQSLLAISGTPPGTHSNVAEQRIGRLRSELDYTTIQEVIDGGLHEFIDAYQAQLNLVGDAIYETFFAMKPIVGQKQEAKRLMTQSQS